MRTAIIGSNGQNASAWTRAFRAAGFEVIQLVRDPRPQPSGGGLSQRRLDLADTGSYGPALAGVEVLGLVTPGVPGQSECEVRLAEAALAAGVGRIVKLSGSGADLAEPISQFARWQAEAEAGLRSLGIPSVMLRSNYFMQNLLRQRAAIAAGTYAHFHGTQRAAYIDVADIAAVAAAVAAGGFDGRALELTGPESLGTADIAAALTAAAGRDVTVVSLSPCQVRDAVLAQGGPTWLADVQHELAESMQGGRGGHVAAVTPDVAAVTGRAPRTLRQFLVQDGALG